MSLVDIIKAKNIKKHTSSLSTIFFFGPKRDSNGKIYPFSSQIKKCLKIHQNTEHSQSAKIAPAVNMNSLYLHTAFQQSKGRNISFGFTS